MAVWFAKDVLKEREHWGDDTRCTFERRRLFLKHTFLTSRSRAQKEWWNYSGSIVKNVTTTVLFHGGIARQQRRPWMLDFQERTRYFFFVRKCFWHTVELHNFVKMEKEITLPQGCWWGACDQVREGWYSWNEDEYACKQKWPYNDAEEVHR